MAKEKVKNTQAQEQQYANKYVIAMAKENAIEASVKMQIKSEDSLAKYQKYKALGKYKEAIQELKWYNINEKLKNLTDKIIDFLERMESFEMLIQTLEQVNIGLTAITGFQQGGDLKSLKKNLKGMGKCIKKMDKFADELLASMDNLFGDKPNIFVRMYRAITGKKVSDADVLADLESKINPTGTAPTDTQVGGGTEPVPPKDIDTKDIGGEWV
jgi:hypothetical protein